MAYNVCSFMNKNTVILIRNAMPYDFGGGERVPVFIARETQKHSSLKPIVFSRSKKLLDFAKINGVPHKRTWWWSRQNWSGARVLLTPVYFIWQFALFLYYVSLFLRHKPRTVHIQGKDDFIAGTYAARAIGARVIWSDYADLKHIFLNHSVWYKNPIGKAVYLAAHFAEKIIVVSKQDRQLVAKHIPDGSVKQKMEVIYNGAFDSYKPADKDDIFTFVSTGRLVTDKGIGELIDAFKRVHSDHKHTRLYLIGDGPEREEFEQRAEGDKSIQFLGHQKNPLEYVAKSHVFLLPTYHEGFSLALVEACMLQMPIIATNVGGNPEIIKDGKTGLLVEVKNVDELYSAMIKLFEDEKLRKKLSMNARDAYVKDFDFESIIKDIFIPIYEGRS
jgi:glycosyltransferase involved in cell wall biosynthesis